MDVKSVYLEPLINKINEAMFRVEKLETEIALQQRFIEFKADARLCEVLVQLEQQHQTLTQQVTTFMCAFHEINAIDQDLELMYREQPTPVQKFVVVTNETNKSEFMQLARRADILLLETKLKTYDELIKQPIIG